MLNFQVLAAIGCLSASLLSAADERPGQTFKTPSGMLYFETLGSSSGTPLVIANGGPGFDHAYLHFSDAWDVLAKSRKVILYDQRGLGRSSKLSPGQSCTLLDQIEDLEALRAQIGAERMDLLGHSWGGYLVMAYAARYPHHIQHLLIVDSAAPKWTETVSPFKDIFPEGIEREAALAFASALGDKAAARKSLLEYMSMLFYSPEHRAAAMANIGDVTINQEINDTLNHDLERFDLNSELAKYRFPTIVMTGRFDINVAPVTAYKIHKAIAGSQFVVFEQSGHFPFYEERDKFVSAVESFVRYAAARLELPLLFSRLAARLRQ